MIKFGTSGFRGIIGDNFTKENMQRIAFALKKINVEELKINNIFMGFDNRFLSCDFLKWFLEVFYDENFNITFHSRSVPSPLISFESKNGLGIMLTASHNPYYYNGIKVFINGKEIGNDIAEKIEKYANNVQIESLKIEEFNKIEQSSNFKYSTNIKDYCNSILNLVNTNIINNQTTVCFNAMHGSATECVQYIFNQIGLKNVLYLNTNIDPYFDFNLPAPYPKNLEEQIEQMKNLNIDIGFAVDGDGDRFAAIDKNGKIFDCNYIMALLYNYLLQERKIKQGIILDVATTSLIKKIAKKFNCEAIYSEHGFKNIGENIIKNNALMGGESNGIAFKQHLLSKDGIVLIPMILELINKSQKSLTDLVEALEKEFDFKSCIKEYNYIVSNEEKKQLNKLIFQDKFIPKLNCEISSISYFDGLKINLLNDYWICIRFSGNENVIRIFVEENSYSKCDEINSLIAQQLNLNKKQ